MEDSPTTQAADVGGTAARPKSPPTTAGVPSDRQLQALIASAIPEDVGLTAMKGFSMDLSANPGFRKVFFSARCRCGTAALLSVEVARGKTIDEVTQALPSLVGRLESQARSFHAMSCDNHTRMRLGRVAGR